MAELRNMPAKVFTVALALSPWLERRFRSECDCLSETECALASRMGRYDKAHAARMAAEVSGDDVLKRAALLHDVGKTDPHLNFVFRVLYTNLELFVPFLLKKCVTKLGGAAGGDGALQRTASLPRAWMRAFYAQAHHAALGGEMIEMAGSDPEVVALVSGHQDSRDTFGERALRLCELDSSK